MMIRAQHFRHVSNCFEEKVWTEAGMREYGALAGDGARPGAVVEAGAWERIGIERECSISSLISEMASTGMVKNRLRWAPEGANVYEEACTLMDEVPRVHSIQRVEAGFSTRSVLVTDSQLESVASARGGKTISDMTDELLADKSIEFIPSEADKLPSINRWDVLSNMKQLFSGAVQNGTLQDHEMDRLAFVVYAGLEDASGDGVNMAEFLHACSSREHMGPTTMAKFFDTDRSKHSVEKLLDPTSSQIAFRHQKSMENMDRVKKDRILAAFKETRTEEALGIEVEPVPSHTLKMEAEETSEILEALGTVDMNLCSQRTEWSEYKLSL